MITTARAVHDCNSSVGVRGENVSTGFHCCQLSAQWSSIVAGSSRGVFDTEAGTELFLPVRGAYKLIHVLVDDIVCIMLCELEGYSKLDWT